MRLWSLHPRHLDRQGLTGCWRESLLAQAVLAGRTRGYRSHPQLERFRAQADPLVSVGAYLEALAEEASTRGYRFDRSRIDRRPAGSVGDGADDVGAAADGDGHDADVPRIKDGAASGEAAHGASAGAVVSRVEVPRIPVTSGQLDLEWRHLLHKLEERSPELWERANALEGPTAHPLFEVVPGPVESWERAEDPPR